MMITKFNKSKCLFKEIVKIPELCFDELERKRERERERERKKEKFNFQHFFSLQFVLLLKFFTCMSIKSLFHYTRYSPNPSLLRNLLCFPKQKSLPLLLLFTLHERLFFENFKLNNKLVFVQMLLQVCLLAFLVLLFHEVLEANSKSK